MTLSLNRESLHHTSAPTAEYQSSPELLTHRPPETREASSNPKQPRQVGGRALIAFESEPVALKPTERSIGEVAIHNGADTLASMDQASYGEFQDVYARLGSPTAKLDDEGNVTNDYSILFPAPFLNSANRNSSFDNATEGRHAAIESRFDFIDTHGLDGAAQLLDEMKAGEQRDYAAHWISREYNHQGRFVDAAHAANHITEPGRNAHIGDLIVKRIKYYRAEGLDVDMSPAEELELHNKTIENALKAHKADDASAFNKAVIVETLVTVPGHEEYAPWKELVDTAENVLQESSEKDIQATASNLPDDWRTPPEQLY